MITLARTWLIGRRNRLFVERSSLAIPDKGLQEEYRRRFWTAIRRWRENGTDIRLDSRFRFHAGPGDADDERIDLILRRFNGLEYLNDIRFEPGLETRLMASYQREGVRFEGKRLPRRAPAAIRLIDTHIGFGVFAERDLFEGDFLGEYAGIVRVSDTIQERTYCYEYPLLKEGEQEIELALDAGPAGNETRFINHAKLEMVAHQFEFSSGHWHTLLTVGAPIPRGAQILMDYGDLYWTGRSVVPDSLIP
jgi:hypothetical protein